MNLHSPRPPAGASGVLRHAPPSAEGASDTPAPLSNFQNVLKVAVAARRTLYPEGMADSKAQSGSAADRLALARDRFIALWGEMGSAWGIPRTMAEAHALLYIVGEPLNADDVMERLSISRGNASMTLRTLLEWGLISRIHNRGDRREYFKAEQDVWKLFATIVRERKRREFDPLLEALEGCRALTEPSGSSRSRRASGNETLEAHHERLDDMLELVRTLDRLSERLITSGGPGLTLAAKLLSKVPG